MVSACAWAVNVLKNKARVGKSKAPENLGRLGISCFMVVAFLVGKV